MDPPWRALDRGGTVPRPNLGGNQVQHARFLSAGGMTLHTPRSRRYVTPRAFLDGRPCERGRPIKGSAHSVRMTAIAVPSIPSTLRRLKGWTIARSVAPARYGPT